MCKSSVYFVVPPYFRLGPPHFVWSGDGTAGSVWYLVPQVLIETRDKKLSNTISDMNVFLPSTAFAFSCLEKHVFLQYLVVSGKTYCDLLFDDFSL